jgi:predicted dehydrogenase
LADTRARFDSVFLGRATTHLPAAPEPFDDRGLLHASYAAVDLMVLFMGVPEIVFANVYDSARLGSGSGGETADTAVLTFRYANGASAVVTAAQVIGEPACQVRFDGPNVAAVVNGSDLAIHHRTNAPDDVIDLDLGPPFRKQLRERLSGSEAPHRKAIASIQSHLPTMTVIEAAVLSSKTAQPESPDKLLQQHGLHLDPAVSPFLGA